MGTWEQREETLVRSVVGCFFQAYNKLGYGFLESVYIAALEKELTKRGHLVGREVSVQIMYDGEELARQRLDMVVDECLVIETKATELLQPSASRQLYNYLRASKLEVGLLLHFGPIPHFWRVNVRVKRSDGKHVSHEKHASPPLSLGPARAAVQPADSESKPQS